MEKHLKVGRPPSDSEKPSVKVIHVSLDEVTAEALKSLEQALGPNIRKGRTSIAVRRAICQAASGLIKGR